jgi:hypothetical protein
MKKVSTLVFSALAVLSNAQSQFLVSDADFVQPQALAGVTNFTISAPATPAVYYTKYE